MKKAKYLTCILGLGLLCHPRVALGENSWFACGADADCSLEADACGYPIAVNVRFREPYRSHRSAAAACAELDRDPWNSVSAYCSVSGMCEFDYPEAQKPIKTGRKLARALKTKSDNTLALGSQALKAIYDQRALRALKQAATTQVASKMQTGEYVSCLNEQCLTVLGFKNLENIEIEMKSLGTHFTGAVSSRKGEGRTFRWDSSAGGLQP